MGKLRIIVTGLIGQYPLGGVSWDYLQYVLGLKLLGHDVYYLEDSGQWPFSPLQGGTAKDGSFTVDYLSRLMASYELNDRWAYCFPWESRWFGLPDSRRESVLASADVLINVSGTLAQPERYRQIPMMIYIDSDPVFTQVKLARGQRDFQRMVALHDQHFSFGETLGARVPPTEFDWLPTRQPVVLKEWQPLTYRRDAFTTVMNWTSYKPLEYAGRSFGQKDVEFRDYLDLPSRVPNSVLEIAVNSGKTKRTPVDLLRNRGWRVVHPDVVCPDMDSYREYIRTSKAEWSVAKNGYVQGDSGWFSCRSACYLASGRPVVLQDTGFSRVLPCGEGILAFTSLDEAVAGIQEVDNSYPRHSEAAAALASTFFDSNRVLSDLLDRAYSASAPRAGEAL